MKTLAVRQPWATYIAEGSKTVEVRSWLTRYRGPLLIAASGRPMKLENVHGVVEVLPTQVLVCVVDLFDVRPLLCDDSEEACAGAIQAGDEVGLYAWVLANPRHVVPVIHRGKLRLYETPDTEVTFLPDAVHYLDVIGEAAGAVSA